MRRVLFRPELFTGLILTGLLAACSSDTLPVGVDAGVGQDAPSQVPPADSGPNPTPGHPDAQLPGDGASPAQPDGGGATVPQDPGTRVTLTSPQAAERTSLDQKLAGVAQESAATVLQRSALPFTAELGYDPGKALHFDLLQKSDFRLSEAEEAAFRKNGFVWTKKAYPNFTYGYDAIYADDLPVFISADSMMYAVHRSFDTLLAQVEQSALLPALQDMVARMRQGIVAGIVSGDQRADMDVYLAVAHGLLAGKFAGTVDNANEPLARRLFDKVMASQGAEKVTLFGNVRDEDFSQFTPRGHYTDSEALTRYFRAHMWLGRIDFRLIETQSDGSQLFRRRQLMAAYALRDLMDQTALAEWSALDQVVSAFIGEHDFMILPQLDQLLVDLHVTSSKDLASVDDQTIAQAIVNGGYGTQRILSHIIINDTSAPLPFDSSFALAGQRYVVDSHVFSNVVYDRVNGRLMPNPLDVAYAALGNDQAALLLKPELESPKAPTYASALAKTRTLVDTYPSDFWQNSLYNRWLTALRDLSPKASELRDPKAAGLPKVATTEAWGRRVLNTQLASWAELRHDTILYAKQSYSSGVSCEFPDAYVEPNPAFFRSLAAYAEHGGTLMGKLRTLLPNAGTVVDHGATHYSRLRDAALQLEDMATRERRGEPFTAEQLAFINQTVKVQQICGGAFAEGWYPSLFLGNATESDPTIADVHTQPTDEAGAMVGRVLHVGTGDARAMVVSFDTCVGPRVYVGVVSSYYEHVTESFKRLDDPTWAKQFRSEPSVPWVRDLMP